MSLFCMHVFRIKGFDTLVFYSYRVLYCVTLQSMYFKRLPYLSLEMCFQDLYLPNNYKSGLSKAAMQAT